MNFTKILETQRPELARARPWLYAHAHPRVVFASREGQVTTSVMIPRLKLPLLFAALGNTQGVPSCIQPILDRFRFVLIDLASITETVLRFYIFPSDADTDADYNSLYTDLYPFHHSEQTLAYHPQAGQNMHLECLGFLVDQQQNRVDYYKYYWVDVHAGLLHNTRFTAEGQWVEHWTEQRRQPVVQADIEHFGIQGLRVDPDRHIWVERTEPGQDRQYLTILQRRPYRP